MGSRILNGLGGSADFLRSSKISIMHTPSTRPSKTDPTGVSCIVPMCTHVDQTEHDLDVIVTEKVSQVVRKGILEPTIVGSCRRPWSFTTRTSSSHNQQVCAPRVPADPHGLFRASGIRMLEERLGPRATYAMADIQNAQGAE